MVYHIMLFLYCLIFAYFSFSEAAVSSKIKRVIVDVDGGIDDYQALVFLLEAHYYKQIKIETITCTNGNTQLENVEKNVMRLLEIVRMTSIPVYTGSYHSILTTGHSDAFFGLDGFADLTYEKQPDLNIVKRNMISPIYINKLIKENPGEISIIVLGPLTNIGLMLIMFPEAKDQIKEMYCMGGSYKGVKKEFNFLFDPESVYVTFKLANFPITLLTWEGCLSQKIPMSWRFGLKMTKSNYVWNLMEKAEKKQFAKFPGIRDYESCDPILAAIFLDNTLITDNASEYATMELQDISTRGDLIIEDGSVLKNVRFITNFDSDRYKNRFVKTFENICKMFRCKNIYQ